MPSVTVSAQMMPAGPNPKLEELVTRRYPLDDIAQGFEDMHAGRNLRGVVTFGS
jgi:Zn-dependent alcohol dehydrogenase